MKRPDGLDAVPLRGGAVADDELGEGAGMPKADPRSTGTGGARRADPMMAVAPGAGFLSIVRSIGLPAEAFEAGTIGHSERVATYATEVATALGLPVMEIRTVRLGAYLHDVGKLWVPREILGKPGRLSPDEYAVMKMHAVWGLSLLDGLDLPEDVRSTVRWHHEKYDGTGYPDGLRGEEIPLHASIVGIADVYDALTSSRSYRPAMTNSGALALMQARRGWWRPEVHSAFVWAAGTLAPGAAPAAADSAGSPEPGASRLAR